jgi:uncharacterized protein
MPWSLRMVSYAAIILLVLFTYFGFRYIRCIRSAEWGNTLLLKSLYAVAALLFFSYPVGGLIQYWLSGSFNRTGFPDVLIYLFWYGLIFSGVMLNWNLLHDLLLPVVRRVSGRPGEEIRKRFARIFLVLTAGTMIYTSVKLVWDTHRITTETIDYVLPEGHSDFSPLTIVHIADLHADAYTNDRKMERYVNRINAFQPDLVLFGGDLITSGADHVINGADALAGIRSTYGTYAVLGDHDFWNDPVYIREILVSRGITVLDDENFRIDHNGSIIKLTGITELYSKRVPTDALSALLRERNQGSLNILFSHQASDRLIEQSEKSGIHLLLGAHTHGGQIRIPVFFYKATAVREETRYVNGHWMLGDMLLNVNSGLGFTLSPVRYNAPAQVSVITLGR